MTEGCGRTNGRGWAIPGLTDPDTYTHLFNNAAHANTIRQQMAASGFGQLLARD